jgi:triosephosphate isomerase
MTKLIIGNWKMFPGTLKEAKTLMTALAKSAKGVRSTVVVCPPLAYLGAFAAKQGGIRLGAQNLSLFSGTGAQTGEVSPEMIASIGAQYVLVGHSERRAAGENEEIIAQKVRIGIDAGLTIVLCVGEKERDASGAYFTTIRGQLRSALETLPSGKSKNIVIAYEPVWAIGAKAKGAATPESVREMTVYIRKELTTLFGKFGRGIPVLYGGSVDEKNASTFLSVSGADGLLIGRVSLEPARFLAIAKEAGKL